jgi:heme/copper-type cytochrome/quinol oxidase subunit 2
MSHQISAVLYTPKYRRNQGPAEETFETEKDQQVARIHVSYIMVVVVVVVVVVAVMIINVKLNRLG